MLVGAIWSPVFKQELGIGAAVLGGAAVAIPFVTGWWILCGVGIAAIGIIVWAARKHYHEQSDATGVYRAVQAFKSESGDLFKQHLAPKVKDFLGRYTKGGKVVANAAAEARIDQRLMQVGDL